ncbi:hypothetical protein CC1G_00787 [Coprinopsis cinerea okayama7|uniref:NAD(P)-binding domain-containing protein n=1 Tax=Coprinopsis cinerea (strain Okayama-7 / 130 / ATCC MYA-4618 / FGSC 9003) TaxID=240176 RepID=A8N8R2_COPC7|nr:hypothetical protein CC1G_00787 [Coprinopsis cinerea okayama7\|eukprot:XP_001831240.1 hypothetical protein CC1G_00787 [Coprinopsis cinerea okayama7\
MTTPTTSSKTALLFGATGQVGQQLLRTLLGTPYYTKVGEYGRRVTPQEQIESNGKEKLMQGTVDFETVTDKDLGEQKWDDVFISLGTTRKNAGSAANFEKIDREYVINAAKAAKSSDPQSNQKLLYVSSTGANSKSPFLYPKSKGLTEEGLARLGYSDTIIFRPGFLAGTKRPETRLAESIFGGFTRLASYVTDTVEIEISTLAKAMLVASKLGSEGLPPAAGATKVKLEDGTTYTVIGNAGAIALAKLE